MRTKIITLLFAFFMPFVAMADDTQTTQTNPAESIPTLEYKIERPTEETPCATAAFEKSLEAHATTDVENGGEIEIKTWIRAAFAHTDTLKAVLECPEIKSRDENETIRFYPIEYTFPNSGREIVINYETQPKIFRQRVALAERHDLPPAAPTADIENDGNEWTNTYPAWYGIMITKHGALDNFVGPDKHNTISLDYIRDNIDKLHPNRYACVGETALAGDFSIDRDPQLSLTIRAHVSDIENDKNDYYVAANNDLRWIGWAEVALDIGLMLLTAGGNLLIKGGITGIRVTQISNRLIHAIKGLEKSADVAKYINKTADLKNIKKEIDATESAIKANKLKLKQLDDEIAELTKKLDDPNLPQTKKIQIKKEIRLKRAHNGDFTGKAAIEDILEYNEKILKRRTDKMKGIENEIEALKKTEDVTNYIRYTDELAKLEKVADATRTIRTLGRVPQTGNAVSRVWKNAKALRQAYKTVNKANKTLKGAARVARSSMKSGRLRDWLFQTSMKNVGALAKMAGQTTLLIEGLEFVGDFWDMTHASTGDFTNGIDFNPMLLLGADDIPGQEDVVNYGMWLMWQGSSTSPSDDDAAYLQAMDYAAKVHLGLMQDQNSGNYPCDVDIWVVRPIIQNPESPNPELYYLIMNDIPWTTGQ